MQAMPEDAIAQWLDQLGLIQYASVFADNAVDFEVLPELTEADLESLGMLLGHRKKLLKAIAGLSIDTDTPANAPGERPRVPKAERPGASAGAERRQVTVMFCDLVGSTELSGRLDPEDLREVMRHYQDAVAGAVTRYEGYVAKFLGDGVLAYFGWPQAHEDQAERAVRAGLNAVSAVARLTFEGDISLAARVGIATGQVVVGDLVGETASEAEAIAGETPNLAARLESVAEPGQVVIGPRTHDLVGETFDLRDLGTHQLKGFPAPVQAWCAMSESGIHNRYAARHVGGALPLVGRQEELGLLLRSWQSSKDEHGQVVLIQGEAGIGKSRLVEALSERAAGDDHTWVTLQCSPHHTNSTLYPVKEHLKRVMGWKSEDDPEERLRKLELTLADQSLPLDEAVPLYAELLSLPLPEGRYAAPDLSAKQMREQTLDALAAWSLEMAERKPVLNVWEDLHWADPTTLELLTIYIDQSPTVPMLNLLIYRPEFVPPWTMRGHMTPITLNRLERPEVEALIRHQAAGKAVPLEVVEHIIAKTDGVPLFVEELTKSILDSDYLREEEDCYALSGSLSDVLIPATLQDSLMARLDRLPRVRELAQLGSVLGREFAYEMILSLGSMDEPGLLDGLSQLVDDEILYQRGRPPRARYIFKHALIQDAAYQSLLRRTRQAYHRQVAALICERFPETVEAHPELVAHHCIEAGMTTEAIDYCYLAGERARSRCAYHEAIAHLSRGISVVGELADQQERESSELRLQFSLGGVYLQMKGHMAPEVEVAFVRARELCQRVRGSPELVPTMFGLWRTYVVQLEDSRKPREVAGELLRLAEEDGSAVARVVAHYACGFTALVVGDLQAACEHLEEGIRLYSPDDRDTAAVYRFGQDPCVGCRCYLAIAKWVLGYPDEAIGHAHEGIAMARELDDPFTIAFSNDIASFLDQALGNGRAALSKADEAVSLATEKGFPYWDGIGKVMQGWGRAIADPTRETVLELKHRIEHHRSTGTELFAPYFYAILGEIALVADALDVCSKALDRASEVLDQTGERWWESEIHRLRGDLLAAQNGDAAEAERHFEKAVEIAHSNDARSLELRAATSLAKQWRQRRKPREARDLLAARYGGFTEGFETADLKTASALIEDLA
jgi:class 3 adenylate cyclase/predicted ATPase